LGVLAEGREPSKAACANVDMYSGLVFRMLDIPESLYGPLFAMSRTASWCAHRVEEVLSGNRMMRPAYRSVSRRTDYVPIEHRG
jgi:citrate synthase